MQAACDAGALAARRAMVTDTFTTAHQTIGFNFFDQNFETDMFGIEERTRNYTGNADGVVTGTASGTLPTSIMGVFGYDEFEIDVTCSAEINISNTDIMFVFDVTGSMAWLPNGTNCGTSNGRWIECTGSRISGLRTAAVDFFDTVEAATADAAQVRYGIVPYASNVNVGFSLPTQFLATTHTYQSRVARFREQFDTTTIPGSGNGIKVGDDIVVSDEINVRLPRNKANFGSTNNNHYRFRNSNKSNRENAQEFCWDSLPGTILLVARNG